MNTSVLPTLREGANGDSEMDVSVGPLAATLLSPPPHPAMKPVRPSSSAAAIDLNRSSDPNPSSDREYKATAKDETMAFSVAVKAELPSLQRHERKYLKGFRRRW